jgi:hypothetical protein
MSSSIKSKGGVIDVYESLKKCVKGNERINTDWRKMGVEMRAKYEDRETMNSDIINLTQAIISGFTEDEGGFYLRHLKDATDGKSVWCTEKGSGMKGLSQEQAVKRESWNRTHRKLQYYIKRMWGCAFPTENELVKQHAEGMILATPDAYKKMEWTVIDGCVVKLDETFKEMSMSSSGLEENETDDVGDDTKEKNKTDTKAVSKVKTRVSQDKDLYATMSEDVEILLYFINPLQFENIYEPMCGNGAISGFLAKAGYTVIASDKYNYPECEKDFLGSDFQVPVGNIIVSNPPFVDKYLYLDKCLQFKVPTMLLLPVNFLGTAMFIRQYQSFCNGVLLIVPRPRFFVPNKVKPTSLKGTNCAWFFFNMGSTNPMFSDFIMSVDKKTGVYDFGGAKVEYERKYFKDDTGGVIDDEFGNEDADVEIDDETVVVNLPKPILLVNCNGKVSITGVQGKLHLFYVDDNDDVFYDAHSAILGKFDRMTHNFDFDIKNYTHIVTEKVVV